MQKCKLTGFKICSYENRIKEEFKNHNYDKCKQILNELNSEERMIFLEIINSQIVDKVKEITELQNIVNIYCERR